MRPFYSYCGNTLTDLATEVVKRHSSIFFDNYLTHIIYYPREIPPPYVSVVIDLDGPGLGA